MSMTIDRERVEVARPSTPPGARRIGYGIGIGVGAALLYVANHLLEWGWFGWLTDDFELVLPIVNVSIWAGIVCNALYLFYDAQWFRLFTQIPQLVISGLAGWRLLDVFPFDFSAYDFPWDSAVRWGIIVSLVAMVLALVGVSARLIRAPFLR